MEPFPPAVPPMPSPPASPVRPKLNPFFKWMILGIIVIVVLVGGFFIYIKYLRLGAMTTEQLKTHLQQAGLTVVDHQNSPQEQAYIDHFVNSIKAIDSSAFSGPKGERANDDAYWDIGDIEEVEVDEFDTPTDAHLYYDQQVNEQNQQSQDAATGGGPYLETDYYISGNLVMSIPRFSATLAPNGGLGEPQQITLDQTTLNKILTVFTGQ